MHKKANILFLQVKTWVTQHIQEPVRHCKEIMMCIIFIYSLISRTNSFFSLQVKASSNNSLEINKICLLLLINYYNLIVPKYIHCAHCFMLFQCFGFKHFKRCACLIFFQPCFQMSLPHSGHRMSSLSVRKPLPTRDTEHFLQLKQSLCHWRSSKEMYLLPPSPVCDDKHVMSTSNKQM